MKGKIAGTPKNQAFSGRRYPTQQIRRIIVGVITGLGLAVLLAPLTYSQGRRSADPGVLALGSIAATNPNPKNNKTHAVNFDKSETYQGRIDVGSDGKWRVIRFNKLSPAITLVVAKQAPGYPTNREAILENNWYSFQTTFSFIVKIEKTAQPQLPLEIPYDVSTLKVPQDGLTPEKARQWASTETNVDPPQVAGLLIRFVDANPLPMASPTATSSLTPTPTATASSTPPDPPNGGLSTQSWLIIAAIALVIVGFGSWLLTRSRSNRAKADGGSEKSNRRRSPQYSPTSYQAESVGFFSKLRRKKTVVNTDNMFAEIEPLEERKGQQPEQKPGTASTPASQQTAASVPFATPPGTDDVVTQWGEVESTTQRNVSGARETQPLDQKTNTRLQKLENDLKELQQKALDKSVAVKLEQLEKVLEPGKGLREEIRQNLEKLRSDLTNDFDEKLDVYLKDDLKKQQAQISQAQQSSENAIAYMQSLMADVEKREKIQADKAKETEKQQHDLYSGILGDFLGLGVETLKEGNFEAIIEEASRNLNRLFSEQPSSADGLAQLQQRAEAINSRMQTTVESARKIKPELEKLQPYGERARGLASELTQASSQLQSKPRNFRATLDFPVEKFPKAREIFLEDLGKAVKEQVDRLHDPVAFWSKELELFATSDILAVADICDSEVTGRPGGNQELEESLSGLFRQAGLTAIVPAPGEPFKPGEQHLINMIVGSPADSQKIKRVVKRGFYYTANAKEPQLIRKAGVEIYR